MKLHTITKSPHSKSKNRVGRGIAAGQGKTAGRGTKGQKSRSGYNIPKKFEGGQTPLVLRLPKVRGLKRQRQATQIVDRAVINRSFANGDTVSPQTLYDKKIIKDPLQPVKILGKTTLTVDVSFVDVKLSAQI